MAERRFLQGFGVALLLLGLVCALLQLIFTRAGELGGPDPVIDRQLAAPNADVLYLSGINQNFYRYKLALFDRVRPEVVAIGSSRSMEVRSEFFAAPAVTLGGAINNLDNLETVAAHVASAGRRPQLAIIFVDPWLFNARYTDNQAPVPPVARYISADMIWTGLRAMRRGNWMTKSFHSPNLGIQAILQDEGFARDGSTYYNLTGSGVYDTRFATTFGRINGNRQNFQRNDVADPALLGRICGAINRVQRAVGHIVVVAPPFARPIWARLAQPDYAYIGRGYRALQQCIGAAPLFNFADPASISGTSDCEFVDGLHGGDVVYARMMRQIAAGDPVARALMRADYLQDYVARYAGHAGGSTLARRPGAEETDFLGIGCRK